MCAGEDARLRCGRAVGIGEITLTRLLSVVTFHAEAAELAGRVDLHFLEWRLRSM